VSASLDPTLRTLTDCGCCEGVSVETPARVFNRPGLSAIAYRVGTHAQFKETLLARLSASHETALRDLNTRSDEDFSIALLDAWATILDVLTFYQERIVNESYLRTATERLSILELARLIGYELRPGVAATTYLAFTLDDAPGAFGQAVNLSVLAQNVPEVPPPIRIDPGVKVQSVPRPGEQAQLFETVETIEARVEWNALRPRLTEPQRLSRDMESVVFQGTATNVSSGDKLLIDAPDGQSVRTVLRVTTDDGAQTTRVDLEKASAPLPPVRQPGLTRGSFADFASGALLNEHTVRTILARRWKDEDVAALARIHNWPVPSLVANIAKQVASRQKDGPGVFAFRRRSAIFGHNAPLYDTLLNASGHLVSIEPVRGGDHIQTPIESSRRKRSKGLFALERSFSGVPAHRTHTHRPPVAWNACTMCWIVAQRPSSVIATTSNRTAGSGGACDVR
jgi:hypothetical protein